MKKSIESSNSFPMSSHILLAGERLLSGKRPDSTSDPPSAVRQDSSHDDNILSSPSKGECKTSSPSQGAEEYNPTRRSIIDHTYRDFSGFGPSKQNIDQYKKVEQSRGDIKAAKKVLDGKNFPHVLHFVLSLEEDFRNIITWLPHGRSFIVRDKQRFIDNVASSHHFKFTKYESFIRQINGWGFKRITQGHDIHSYYHELFLKGMPHLIKWMKRSPATSLSDRSRGGRPLSRPCDEPNFYLITANYPIPDHYNADKREPVVRRDLCRDDKSTSLSHQDENQANIANLLVPPADRLALGSQQDITITDCSEGTKSDITMMDTFFSRPHKEDSPLDKPREQGLHDPSENDWQWLWDALNADAERNRNKQQNVLPVEEHELKFFIVDPMTME